VPDDELVAQPVKLARRNPRPDVRCNEIERSRRQATGLSHGLEIRRTMQLDVSLVVVPVLVGAGSFCL
jgi:hypothetical protein